VVGMLGFCDPLPDQPPRLDRAEDGMSIWVIGQEPNGDFAASAYDRIINANLGGRPLDVDGDKARRVIAATATLAYEMPVLHDISTGGLAVALAEIAFKSGVGFTLDDLAHRDLFDETPLRVIAVGLGNSLDTLVPHKRIGTFTGDVLDFATAGSISLDKARTIWSDALPRRMH
jgi:phosphoribosylformylglycinamidine (FGAM) synthase-like enzyme